MVEWPLKQNILSPGSSYTKPQYTSNLALVWSTCTDVLKIQCIWTLIATPTESVYWKPACQILIWKSPRGWVCLDASWPSCRGTFWRFPQSKAVTASAGVCQRKAHRGSKPPLQPTTPNGEGPSPKCLVVSKALFSQTLSPCLSSWTLRKEDTHKLQASLGYSVRLCFKRKQTPSTWEALEKKRGYLCLFY